jgi:hypothetical protein
VKSIQKAKELCLLCPRFEIAREVDPKGERTLPIMSKIDLVDQGTQNKVIDTFAGTMVNMWVIHVIINLVSDKHYIILCGDSMDIAREVDPKGERTLPIMSKIDLVDQGTQNKVIDMIEVQNTSDQLGWVVVLLKTLSQRIDAEVFSSHVIPGRSLMPLFLQNVSVDIPKSVFKRSTNHMCGAHFHR